ncbi:Fe-S oxidoreductase [Acidovorax sp. GBBC 3334]|uniref:Fe-S oxidoreductase n=1 Tax=Acidovorax sp. GBBC 3334 TaxID=2940496 RepID=UPI00230452D2|nr:Fe-S oxidoreductase [Acidovorax sp. GBBC 3334]MDA8455799.1 Fe-S oxidoreductase [Acidovorax sp. GBBC 3334]
MPSSIDPPRQPQGALARLMAEAALQRQNMLIGGTDPASPAGASAPAQATVPGQPPLPIPSSPSLPPGERVSVSPEARARADAAGGGAAGAPQAAGAPAVAGPGGGGPSTGGRAPAGSAGLAAPVPAPAAAVVAGAGTAWPAGGVAGPTRALLGMFVHQLGDGASGLGVVAAQPWTADLARALRAGTLAPDGPGPLQTWRVGQGSVQAEDGERGFSFTLQAAAMPRGAAAAGLAEAGLPAAATPAGAGSAAAGALTVPFPGRLARLESGVFALVLQGRDEAGGATRTSALLSLEFQPPPAQGLYAREWMLPSLRPDPWLQMAALQASGYRREDEEAEAAARRGGAPLCDTPGCPYADRAPCAQPFCMALRVMPPQRSAGP